MNPGFLILVGAPDRLRAALQRSRHGRALLAADPGQDVGHGQLLYCAELAQDQPPWLIRPQPFAGLAWAGRLYPPAGERDRHASAGHYFHAGWVRHGRAWQAELNGEYSFCLLDRSSGQIHAGTDLFGQRSLFHGSVHGVTVLSSSCAAVCALFPDAPLAKDQLARFLRPFSDSCLDLGATFYRDLQVLRAGEWLTLTLANGQREISTIALPDRLLQPSGLSRSALERQFLDLWPSVLGDRIEGNVAVQTLSGGIDSALIALGLQRLRRERPSLRLKAITSVLRGKLGAQERTIAEQVARTLGVQLEAMPRDPGPVSFPFASWVAMADQPLGMSDDLSQVRRLMQLGRPALSGMGADELLASSVRRPGFARAWPFRLERRLRRSLRRSGQVPVDDADLAQLSDDHVPDWVQPEWRETHLEAGRQTAAPPDRPWWSLLLPNAGYRCDLESVDQTGLFLVDVCLPYLDLRIVPSLLDPEVARCDINRWSRRPPKQFLRRLLRGTLPPAVWRRPKQPAGQPLFERLARMDVTAMRRDLAAIDSLTEFVNIQALPEPDIDRPWSSIYSWGTCMSLASWFRLQSGVEAKWAISRK